MTELEVGQMVYWADIVRFEGVWPARVITPGTKMVAIQIQRDDFGTATVFAMREHLFPVDNSVGSSNKAHNVARGFYNDMARKAFPDNFEDDGIAW